MLADPENATRAKLNSVFAQDNSGKNLLKFGEVGQLVDADLKIQNGTITPSQFPPLNHAVTLAKLSLLQPTELNRLVRDLGGEYVSIYGPEVSSHQND